MYIDTNKCLEMVNWTAGQVGLVNWTTRKANWHENKYRRLIEQQSLPSGRRKANWHENKWRRYPALAIDGICYQSSPSRQRRLWLWLINPQHHHQYPHNHHHPPPLNDHPFFLLFIINQLSIMIHIPHPHMTHSQMLGKVEYGGGPIFKVVLEC